MENLLLLVGFLLPPAIDLINRRVSDSDARFWVSVVLCACVGFGVHLATNGAFAGVNLLAKDILAIIGEAQVTYKVMYDGSALQKGIRG